MPAAKILCGYACRAEVYGRLRIQWQEMTEAIGRILDGGKENDDAGNDRTLYLGGGPPPAREAAGRYGQGATEPGSTICWRNAGKTGKTRQENAADALRELGAPSVLAGKYRDDKKIPHWSGLFRAVWFVLKIVLIAVTLGMVVAAIVQGVVWGYETPVAGYIGDVVTMVASGIAGAAGKDPWARSGVCGVTIIFAVIERCSVKIDIREATAGAWKPEDPADKPVPAERRCLKGRFHRWNCVHSGGGYPVQFCTVPNEHLAHRAGRLAALCAAVQPRGAETMLPLFNVCFALELSARRCALPWDGIRCGLEL